MERLRRSLGQKAGEKPSITRPRARKASRGTAAKKATKQTARKAARKTKARPGRVT